MTKTEQARVVAWRLKLIGKPASYPEALLRPAGMSASLAKPSTNGALGTRVTVKPVCAIGPGRLCTARGARLVRSFPRSCICESVTDLDQLGSPAICIAFTTLMWHVLRCIAY